MKANLEKGTKICGGCRKELLLDQFQKNCYFKDGLAYNCKECKSQQDRQFREENKQKNKSRNVYLNCQNSKQCTSCKKFLSVLEFNKKASTSDGLDIYCKECKGIMDQKYYVGHKEEILQRISEPSYQSKVNIYVTARREADPIFKLAHDLRNRVREVLKQKSLHKNSKLREYLGCTLENLKAHLEKQFQPGMSWENHTVTGWHVDHIIPLDLCEIYNLDGSLNTELSTKRLFELCHYTNLQPLWAKDNLRKSNNLCLIN